MNGEIEGVRQTIWQQLKLASAPNIIAPVHVHHKGRPQVIIDYFLRRIGYRNKLYSKTTRTPISTIALVSPDVTGQENEAEVGKL